MVFFSFSSSVLDYPAFPQSMLDTLFEHVLLDDVPHPATPLPDDVLPSCTPQEVEAGYRLSWQLLERGVNRRAFGRLVARIAFTGRVSEEQRLAFKYVRARFKHMRFACANFDRRHRYPFSLRVVTGLMGHMQDAFRNRQRGATFYYGTAVWLALSPLCYWIIRGSLLAFHPETPEGVRAYQQAENQKLARIMTQGEVMTGHEFHRMRKFISRRVAFNDTLRTVRPSEALNQLSEYLATINGMMGDMHDDLVEKKLNGTQNYHRDHFQPPEEIIRRLGAFLQRNGAL